MVCSNSTTNPRCSKPCASGQAWAQFFWYLLHAALSLFYSTTLAFSKFSIKVGSKTHCSKDQDWEHIQHAVRSYRKRPASVGVVVESTMIRQDIDRAVDLLWWLAAAGVQHIAMYDMEGVLKASETYLRNKIELYGHVTMVFYSHDLSAVHNEGNGEFRHTEGNVIVELLSLEDGKGAIISAAQAFCCNASGYPLTEEDLDRCLLQKGFAEPDPDLLFIFDTITCLQGFPPWRIRLTEIVHMGRLNSTSSSSFLKSLEDYSRKTHRYGK